MLKRFEVQFYDGQRVALDAINANRAGRFAKRHVTVKSRIERVRRTP